MRPGLRLPLAATQGLLGADSEGCRSAPRKIDQQGAAVARRRGTPRSAPPPSAVASPSAKNQASVTRIQRPSLGVSSTRSSSAASGAPSSSRSGAGHALHITTHHDARALCARQPGDGWQRRQAEVQPHEIALQQRARVHRRQRHEHRPTVWRSATSFCQMPSVGRHGQNQQARCQHGHGRSPAAAGRGVVSVLVRPRRATRNCASQASPPSSAPRPAAGRVPCGPAATATGSRTPQ